MTSYKDTPDSSEINLFRHTEPNSRPPAFSRGKERANIRLVHRTNAIGTFAAGFRSVFRVHRSVFAFPSRTPVTCSARAPLIRLRHLLPIAMKLRQGEGYLRGCLSPDV